MTLTTTEHPPISEQIVVFEEDFAALPIGVIAGDYSPAGEYHVLPALSESGRWRETVIHHSYRRISRGNWQVVLDEDGRHVLEQTILAEQWQPILAAGDFHWRDVTVEAKIRPLTEKGWRGIIFRYRHGRRFYAAIFNDDELQVIRRDNDDDTILGRTTYALDPDHYATVRIECSGPEIRVVVNGQEAIACADETAGAFFEGCIAFVANQLTRFRDLQVRASSKAAAAMVTRAEEIEQATRRVRAEHPQPAVWRRIKTPHWGTDRNMRVGDIDGDGKPEIVLARRTDRLGNDNYSSITSLAAYDLEGRQLWTIGEPGSNRYHTTSDLCFQLHDIDGDGKAEVFFCKDSHFYIADGATGKIISQMQLPRNPSRDPYELYRPLGDSIYFCDLTGSGRSDSILIKDRYQHVWAYNNQLKPLWSFSGKLGHYPFARDIDDDGKDEVAIGHHLLDHDGTLLWTAKYKDHTDNIVLVDLHDSGGATGPATTRVVLAGSDAGLIMLDLNGQQRLHYPIGHAQCMCFANLLPERNGLELMVNTFWGTVGITAVFDEAGTLLHEYEPMPYATLLQPVNWVPFNGKGTPADTVLLSTHPRQGGLINGQGQRVVMFPDDGHPVLCSDARDLDGDGIDEVLTWDEEEIWIYKAEVPGRDPSNYPRRNPWYNDSNYRAQLSLPQSR